MTEPSVEEVTRRLSSRAPSEIWFGAKEAMIRLSMMVPMIDPAA
jgi:hypothetical protein